MRVLRLVLVSVFALMLLGSSVATAASPHFIGGGPTVSVGTNSLTVSFKAAGLGNVPVATFDLDGTVDVFSRCYNRGGNKPQADNKQETLIVDTTVSFPVRNGQTTGSFTVSPLSTLTCPGNQIVVIESVSYDLTLSGMGLTAHIVG